MMCIFCISTLIAPLEMVSSSSPPKVMKSRLDMLFPPRMTAGFLQHPTQSQAPGFDPQLPFDGIQGMPRNGGPGWGAKLQPEGGCISQIMQLLYCRIIQVLKVPGLSG